MKPVYDMYALEKWLEDMILEAYDRTDYHTAGVYSKVLSKIHSMRVYQEYHHSIDWVY